MVIDWKVESPDLIRAFDFYDLHYLLGLVVNQSNNMRALWQAMSPDY